jgi:hypothetical protein
MLFFVLMNPRKTKQNRAHRLVAREKAGHRCRRLVIRTEAPVDIYPRDVAHHRSWPMATLVVLALVGCGDGSSLGSRGTTQTGGSGGNVDALASGGNAGALASGGIAGTLASGGTSGGGGTTLVDAPNSHCAVGDTSIYNDASLNTVNCDGFTHRVSQNACAPRPPSGNVLAPSGRTDQCYRDADCKGKANGHCSQGSPVGGRSGNNCSYDCLTDSDCGDTGICDCTSNQCATATCVTDSDCAAGKLCLQSPSGYNGLGLDITSYHCQTSNDTCTVSFGSCGLGYNCNWSGDHFACQFSPIP